MVDVYIDKRKTGFVVLAKKRGNFFKRSCYDETVFSFFRVGALPDLLIETYKGINSYMDHGLLGSNEEVHIRSTHRDVFDAFSKGRKSLGKMKPYLIHDDKAFEAWSAAFAEKNVVIKGINKRKSDMNIIYDTPEDSMTQAVLDEMGVLDTQKLGSSANVRKQLSANKRARDLLRDALLTEPDSMTEEKERCEKDFHRIAIYSDGGISIKGNVETGHSYGAVILGLSREGEETCLVKIKGRLNVFAYIKEKHNVDFMELYSAYRALKTVNDKIEEGQIRRGIGVLIKTDNQSNVDVFNGLRESKHIGNTVLWEAIRGFSNNMIIDMSWVKGHHIDEHNNLADELVLEGRKMEQDGEVLLLDTDIKRRHFKM